MRQHIVSGILISKTKRFFSYALNHLLTHITSRTAAQTLKMVVLDRWRADVQTTGVQGPHDGQSFRFRDAEVHITYIAPVVG